MHWLSNVAGCTTIRLPVGYFTLGPNFCHHTPFATQQAEVYRNAWAAVKKLVARCFSHGIGVLLDLHAAPGGANNQPHSGTSSGEAELWGSKSYLHLASQCLCYMAREATTMEGVVGVQLCNEAQWEADSMYKFYDDMLTQISQIDSSLPIYISDGWDLGRALQYALVKNNVNGVQSNPVIVDTHKYYCFAAKDTSTSPQEVVTRVLSELSELDELSGDVFTKQGTLTYCHLPELLLIGLAGAVATFIGEWSCTLSEQTWSKVPKETRAEVTKQFGQTQNERWQRETCGSAFWTLKMDWMPGGDWGFKEQVENSTVTAPSSFRLPVAQVKNRSKTAEEQKTSLMMSALQTHSTYWDKHNPARRFEHWRYSDGVSRTSIVLAGKADCLDSGSRGGLILDISSVRDLRVYFLPRAVEMVPMKLEH